MKGRTILHQFANAWIKSPLLLRAIVTGFSVSAIGIGTWSLALSNSKAPWSIIPMALALWAYLKFFSGSRDGGKNSVKRKSCFRAIKLPPTVWKWGLLSAVLFVVIVQSCFVLTFRLTEFPSEKFTA